MLTKEQAKFIARVGRQGLPENKATDAEVTMARELMATGAMFHWWKGLFVPRYTPTDTALASAIEHLSSVEGAGI